MVNDFREYAGVNEENDYIQHFLYIRKEKKPYGWNYVYPDDQVGQLGVNRINKKTGGKTGKALHSKFAKKLYNDTVQYKRMKADQDMRNSHKGLGSKAYIDHEDHFPFASEGKHQIGATSKVRNADGTYHTIRTQADVGDDEITFKDLKDTFKRNLKTKRDTKKRINKQKLENFLEKAFGYVPMDKLKKRIKSESENRDLVNRFKKKQAVEKAAAKQRAIDKRWAGTDAKTSSKKFKNMEKKMERQYNQNHKNIKIEGQTFYVKDKKINTPFGTSGYVKEVNHPEGKAIKMFGQTVYVKEVPDKEQKKNRSVNQNKARRK